MEIMSDETRWYLDECEGATCTVMIVHGLHDHAGVYEKFLPTLVASGVSVLRVDLRGHGNSPGKRGHIGNSIDDVFKDFQFWVSKIKTDNFILVGHSMGGMLVLRYALSNAPDEVAQRLVGVVSIAPWLKLSFEPPKIKVLFGRLVNFISPSFTMDSELKHEELTRIPEEVEYLRNEPMRHHRISAGTFVLGTDSGAYCLQHASEFKYPLLLLHGTGDAICSWEGSNAFSEAVHGRDDADAEFVKYDGAYHVLHRDLVADEVLKKLCNWIIEHSSTKV
eukprot:TRINITY_DN103_c1_g1_i1.p1 TRINITY_DN103_c1_g1~~TRINITY_DN103_c1_g1_i1.p1  ORF type:complete len:278 (+),score=65.20 TRINITY_DN103_c1_g1_i1:78-911(+)